MSPLILFAFYSALQISCILSSSSSEVVVRQDYEYLENFDHFLKLFSSCTITLINYRGIDFQSNYPIITTRYTVLINSTKNENGISESVITPYENQFRPEFSIKYKRWTYFYTNLAQITVSSWKESGKCMAMFYILPPTPLEEPKLFKIHKNDPNFSFLDTPYEFYYFFTNAMEKWSSSTAVFDTSATKKFKILIPSPHYDPFIWKNTVRSEHEYIPHAIILHTSAIIPNILHIDTNTISARCYHCNRNSSNYYINLNINISEETTSFTKLTAKLRPLEQDFTSVPLVLDDDFFIWTPEPSLRKQHQVQTSGTNLNALNKFKESISNQAITFRNIHNHMDPVLSIDIVFIILAFPRKTLENLTFANINWCNKEPSCTRGWWNFPQIYKVSDATTASVDVSFLPSSKYYTFITCGGGRHEGINFYGFISPFDVKTWIAIIFVSVIGVGSFIFLVEKYVHNSNPSKNIFFTGLILILEQWDRITVLNKTKQTYLYWILGPWILTSLVLSYAYRGQNITQLTAPLGKIGVSTWQHLIDMEFKLYTKILDYDPSSTNISELWKNTLDTEACSYFYIPFFKQWKFRRIKGEFHKFILSSTICRYFENRMNPSLFNLTTKVLYHEIRFYPDYSKIVSGETNFASILASCQKEAVVGWNDDIERIEGELIQKSGLSGFTSKGRENQGLFQSKIAWKFDQMVDRRIYLRLIALQESGILAEWKYIHGLKDKFRWNYLKSGTVTQIKGLNLDGNVVTVFIILLGCLSISIPCFIIEIRLYLLLFCRELVKTIVRNWKRFKSAIIRINHLYIVHKIKRRTSNS